MNYRVEISGAGIAGLAAATTLARLGCDVAVHEHRRDLSIPLGGAILLVRNLVLALESLGAKERAIEGCDELRALRVYDARGVKQQRSPYPDPAFPEYYVSRHSLYAALLESALAAGAQVIPSSRVVDADPDGSLTLEDGQTRRADLIIAADGVGSILRSRLRVRPKVKPLHHYGVRALLDYPLTEAPRGELHTIWNDRLRLGFGQFGNGQSGVYLSAPARGFSHDLQELDLDYWCAVFPEQQQLLKDVVASGARVAPFSKITCSTWSEGRVVLLGDAAHAMPPHVGQGAAMAALDAVHLGTRVRSDIDALASREGSEALLGRWEREVRPLVEQTQRRAVTNCRLQSSWPSALKHLRAYFFRATEFKTGHLADLSLLKEAV